MVARSVSVPVTDSPRPGELEPYDLEVLIAQITDLHVSEPGSLIQAVVDANAMLTSELPMLTLVDWRDGIVVNHTASFLVPEHLIEIPAVVDDWDATRAYLLTGSPMPKTGSVMG